MGSGLNIVLYLLQYSTLFPFSYNHHERRLHKSQKLKFFSIITISSSIIIFLYTCTHCPNFFIELPSVNYLKVMVFILWLTYMIQIFGMLYDKFSKIDEFSEILSELQKCNEQLGYHKRSIENRIIFITFFEFMSYVFILILCNYNIWNDISYEYWIYYNVILITFMWVTLSVLPVYLKFQILTYFLSNLKTELTNIVDEINRKNWKNLNILCDGIDRITFFHVKIGEILQRIMRVISIYVIANIFSSTLTVIWQSYRIMALFLYSENKFQSITAISFDFIVDIFFYGKILVLIVACAHHLCCQYSDSGHVLHSIRVKIHDQRLKQNVLKIFSFEIYEYNIYQYFCE